LAIFLGVICRRRIRILLFASSYFIVTTYAFLTVLMHQYELFAQEGTTHNRAPHAPMAQVRSSVDWILSVVSVPAISALLTVFESAIFSRTIFAPRAPLGIVILLRLLLGDFLGFERFLYGGGDGSNRS